MIKSLLGDDDDYKKNRSKPEVSDAEKDSVENSGEKTIEKVVPLSDISMSEIDTQNDVRSEEDVTTEDEIETIDEIRTAIETGQIPPRNPDPVKPFEVNRPIGQPNFERIIDDTLQTLETSKEIPAKSERELELEKKLAEIEAELLAEKDQQIRVVENEVLTQVETDQKQKEFENVVSRSPDFPSEKNVVTPPQEIKTENAQRINISPKEFTPPTKAEAIKNSGLAWSAAIALFGSVVFMMVLGWGADQFLGSFPWGITGGIIIGAVIGFVQFFRITSQIINPKQSDFDKVSLNANLETSQVIEVVHKPVENKVLEEDSVAKSEKSEQDNNLLEL